MGWPVILTPQSQDDLREIVSYIARDSSERARKFGNTLIDKALFTRLIAKAACEYHLYRVSLYNWAEPLLCRYLVTMIADAHPRGISTLANANLSLPFDAALRTEGRDWPAVAHTMIGRLRLSHLRGLAERVLRTVGVALGGPSLRQQSRNGF